MEKKKKIIALVIGVLALTLAVSISFGFFTFTSNTGGSSNAVTGTTTTTGETKVVSEEFLSHNDSNIYPGHKSISAIKVTATGVNQVNFNINWTGTNTLGTSYKYTIYKTTTEQSPSFNCQVKTEFKVGVGNTYFEECNSDLTALGTSLKTGNITPSNEETTITMLEDQSLQATEGGNIVYYYIIFEYLNEDKNQSSDANGKLNGKINIEVLAPKGQTMDEILASYNTSSRNDFNTVYATSTAKQIFTVEDGLGTSKYFAGAPTDNYVKFGGFYWRIIRMNGDKTTRLIYAGDASVIDGLSNKQEVLANGYDDSGTKYTQIKTSAFNLSYDNNAYVGFKYATGTLRGTTNKSTILEELDTWYEAKLKTSYGKYIDGSTGFCGDRTSYTNNTGTVSGGGTGTTVTYYADFIGLRINKSPMLTCANSSDLYTTSVSSKGNKALTNPIGLINANEVALSGGRYETANQGYYLYINNNYWTMSPFTFEGYARVFVVNMTGQLSYTVVYNSAIGVRPVINLASTTRFVGSGTWDDPFTVI